MQRRDSGGREQVVGRVLVWLTRRLPVLRLAALSAGLAVVGFGLSFYMNAQARAYDRAPVCGPGVRGACRSMVSAEVLSSRLGRDCRGGHHNRAACMPVRYFLIRTAEVSSTWVTMRDTRLPLPEFAPGHRIVAEYWQGAVTSLRGRRGTVLRTAGNPDARAADLRWAVWLAGGLTAVFVALAVVRRRGGMVGLPGRGR